MPAKGSRISVSTISISVLLESENYLDIHEHYRFLKVIGHGQFGVVRVAVSLHNLKGQRFAVKTIPKSKLTRDVQMMLNELDILQSADHPNIIKLYETYEDSLYLHMVMELCSGGSILEHLMQQTALSEATVADIMTKLCLAVNHLHQLHICHRDVKPENCLYLSNEPGAELKLVDFGLSVKFGQDNIEKMSSLVGTPYYMAPEVIRGNYRKECDVWSLGIIMYLLLSGRQPFASSSLQELYQKVIAAEYDFNGEEWTQISDSAKDLISNILLVEPHRRLTIQQMFNHNWFQIQAQRASPQCVPLKILQLLKRKCASNLFQKESMKVILKYLSSSDIEHLKVLLKQNVFKALDLEKTGFITALTIAEAMRSNGFDIAEREITSNEKLRHHQALWSRHRTHFVF